MALAVAICRGFLSSIKVQAMSLEYQRHLAALLMLKAAGELDGATDREVACGLRMGLAELLEIKGYWISREIIDAEYNFMGPKRKPVAPGSSTERVRRYREKQRAIRECNAGNGALHDGVPPVDVTLHETVTVTPIETLPDVSSGNRNGASRRDDPIHVPAKPDSTTVYTPIPQGGPQENPGITIECNAKNATLHAHGESGASRVVVSSSCTSLKDCNNYHNNSAAEPPGPTIGIAPPAESMAAAGQPIQRSFRATGSPPPLREIPPEDQRKEELKILLKIIPEECRDPKLKNPKQAKKNKRGLALLRHVHAEQGFDLVLWSIRYVVEQCEYRDFWAYLKSAYENPKWAKDHRALVEANEEVSQEAGAAKAQAAAEREAERERDRVEREQSEARNRAVEEYIGSLSPSELEALKAEAMDSVHSALRGLVAVDSPALRGKMEEVVSERLANTGMAVSFSGR